jgi:peptidoglycan hydrolase-like protein with peptidoglycan-binding domain
MDLIRRDAWGAAAPKGKPIVIATPVRELFLHHSASPDNGVRSVREIQRFHQETRGFVDVAYTWLYSPRDRAMFEGRGPGVAGAHTRGHNRVAHAVCVLGNYEITKPPNHVIDDLADWARWHGGTWGPNRYLQHLDVTATLCPGKYLSAMVRDINLYAEQDSAAPSNPAPELPATLRRGDTGDDVLFLQTALLLHDGIYGRTTEAAVRAYQQDNGLTVDGICGPQTWRSILSL